MSVYAIGDLQGCLDPLQRLLDKLCFDPTADRLWFCGDLVNRGPQSLETLRFVHALGESALTVLGNHDLHLLAAAEGVRKERDAGMQRILNAADRERLLDWLRHRPLAHYDPELNFHLIHAGLPPQWDAEETMRYARELETTLRSDGYTDFLHHMYGNKPASWSAQLTGIERLRFICNAFTRMRYCYPDGSLEFKSNGAPGTQTNGSLPWFEVPGRKSADMQIVFGHWSTLGSYDAANVFPLDTGCVWGGQLTALQLAPSPLKYFREDCEMAQLPHGN